MSRHNLYISSSDRDREIGRRGWKKITVFFIKCILLLAFLFVFCFGIIMPQYLYGFNASILDKTERAESIQGPKILLIGNSNLVFGIDSGMIEREIGMPVVNMGIHAGLGNAFLDNMARYYVDEGDLVIFCHTEYADDDKILNEELAWITLENHFGLWKILRWKDAWGMVKAYPTYLKDCIDLWTAGEGNQKTGEAYTREYFNEYGDNIYPRTEQQMEFVEGQILIPPINDICMDRLNGLGDVIRAKGGEMVVAAYPIVQCEFTPSAEDYDLFQKELADRLECEVISDFRDYMIDESFFFDSAFHLTDDGVKIRTIQLIEDIREYRSQNGRSAE